MHVVSVHEEPKHAAMRYLAALRQARRPGGVNYISKILDRGYVGQVRTALLLEFWPVTIKTNHLMIVYRQRGAQVFLSKDDLWPGVFQHVTQALTGIGRIQWHVSTTGFQYSQ